MSETRDSPTGARDRVPIDAAGLIEVAGADALAFAHAQFSSDVAGLAPGTWQWSAWLTAQGRVRGVFALLRVADDRLLLWLPLGGARAMRDALARYVLRAKVALGVDDWGLHAGGAPVPARAVVARDGGYAFAPGDSRVAWLGPAPGAATDHRALDAWRLADIAAGLPWIAPATQDEFVPQALDLERLDAIRFDKGCFPGQEIAARLQLEIDELFPVGETLQMLRLAELEGGDIRLTEAGRRFAESEITEKKRIFAQHLLAYLPLAAHIRRVLDERPNREAPKSRFSEELQDHMTPEAAEMTLRSVINWGRFAEIFAYDDDAQRFTLENPS